MGKMEIEKELYEAMTQMEIIDSHEHLAPESTRVGTPVDVFTLFSHYTQDDLNIAGMSEEDYKKLFDRTLPLEQRWKLFAPYWREIRWGCYARSALLAAERFYGVGDINENTYTELSERMQKANTPGIYERVLKDACNIRVALTQCFSTELDSPLLIPLMPLAEAMDTWAPLANPIFEPEADNSSLDDYLDSVRRYVKRVKAEGAIGLKTASNPYGEPNRDEAKRAFDKLRDGKESKLPYMNPIRDYVIDQTISIATEEDMVIAVHTGYWGDFRDLDPLHYIPTLQRHPKARFDIYHLGYPWMRETLMLGKGFANVWLNFCWTHIISQRFAVAGLDEAIDLVPMNKIIGFGGDYNLPVEKVYGHLVMAREDIAEVLARRITKGQMTESQALDLVKKWFWDNPKELYKLEL